MKHTYHIRMRAVLSVALGILWSGPVVAQSCRVQCDGGVSVMASCNTTSDPCPRPPSGGPTPPPPPPNIQQEQILLESLNIRFGVLLDRLFGLSLWRGFGIRDNKALYQNVPPATIVQLNQYIDDIYVSATVQHRYLTWTYEQNKTNLIDYPNEIISGLLQQSALELKLPDALRLLVIAENMRDQEVAKRATEEYSVRHFWVKSDLARSLSEKRLRLEFGPIDLMKP